MTGQYDVMMLATPTLLVAAVYFYLRGLPVIIIR